MIRILAIAKVISSSVLFIDLFNFLSIENEKPLVKDTVDSSTKIQTTDQPRKSTSLFSIEYLTDLEERFEKWINNRSKHVVDDLFDGLKVWLFYL